MAPAATGGSHAPESGGIDGSVSALRQLVTTTALPPGGRCKLAGERYVPALKKAA
jgi:hypothetical protein